MEILSTANHKHVKEVQVQTDVLDVDFATLLSNFAGLHPELNVVELMMLFIKDKVISELRLLWIDIRRRNDDDRTVISGAIQA